MRTIITRADDCGSSEGANWAIFEAVDAGFIRNVSLMACGAHIEESAKVLAGREDICFGMHFTMNSEWDRVKFTPTQNKGDIARLLNEDGEFYSSPGTMVEKLSVELLEREQEKVLGQIHGEWTSQLQKLRTLGFAISYADTHMFPECAIPGLKDAMKCWMAEEGLVDHRYFYHPLPKRAILSARPDLLEEVAGSLDPGQYFFLVHPAKPTEDMSLTGNESYPTEKIVRERQADYEFVVSEATRRMCKDNQIRPIRYDEAVPGNYDSVKEFFGQR